jgi:hypothetical protein
VGLTSGFGMRPGVAPPLWPSANEATGASVFNVFRQAGLAHEHGTTQRGARSQKNPRDTQTNRPAQQLVNRDLFSGKGVRALEGVAAALGRPRAQIALPVSVPVPERGHRIYGTNRCVSPS